MVFIFDRLVVLLLVGAINGGPATMPFGGCLIVLSIFLSSQLNFLAP